MAVLHFIYPITLNPGGTLALIVYNVLSTCMFLVGIVMARDSKRHLWITLLRAMAYFAFSLWYARDPGDHWRVLVAFATLIPFQTTIMLILLRFVFGRAMLPGMCFTPR